MAMDTITQLLLSKRQRDTNLAPRLCCTWTSKLRGGPTLVLSYTSTRDKLIANLLHSFASRTISGHQKLLACWVHSGWGVFSTILKLSIRLRSITAVHLALYSHINVVWRHAMLLLTGETLSASQKKTKPILIFAAQHFRLLY